MLYSIAKKNYEIRSADLALENVLEINLIRSTNNKEAILHSLSLSQNRTNNR